MTGFKSKRAAAQAIDKVNWADHEPNGRRAAAQDKLDDDDIQVYQKPWVDMTPEDYAEIFVTARSVDHAARLTAAKLKEKNS